MEGVIALYIVMLAAFTGYEVIARVPVILHTPLMSGSNFVHGIVLVGAMVALGRADTPVEQVIGFIGVVLGAGNAVGGYVVTSGCCRCSSRAARRRRNPPDAGPRTASVATVAIDFSYLLVAFLFIMGLKAMSSPVTARRGIVVAGVGMLIGTLMSFLYPGMGTSR
jgi:NAD(P) transhydrogenase subunit alpha